MANINNIKVMIVNNRNQLYEGDYEVEVGKKSTEAVLQCLDDYINEKLGFENWFEISKDLWDTVKGKTTGLDEKDLNKKIKLINI